jgi:hypothetical protein
VKRSTSVQTGYLSERAEEHRRLADDNKEDGSTAEDESEGEG